MTRLATCIRSFDRLFLLRLVATLSLLLVVGCGPDRLEVAPVTGKVTFQGKAVPCGSVSFWPQSGRSARGKIGPDGTFTLTTFSPNDGALLGTHCVTIEAVLVHESGPQPTSTEEEKQMAKTRHPALNTKAVVQRLIPQKYSNRKTSQLTAEVVPGENSIDFNLQ